MNLIAKMKINELVEAIQNKPNFVSESLNTDEAMYRPDTKQYCIRGLNFSTIQIDQDEPEEYMVVTMNYHCSFYEEYVYLKDIVFELDRRYEELKVLNGKSNAL